jgi:hypothetical protein
MRQSKRYTVHVEKVVTEWSVVEVEAENQKEAEEFARDSSDGTLCSGGGGQCVVTVLTEDGIPVEWSHEAWRKDGKNPYGRRPFPSAGTTNKQTGNK